MKHQIRMIDYYVLDANIIESNEESCLDMSNPDNDKSSVSSSDNVSNFNSDTNSSSTPEKSSKEMNIVIFGMNEDKKTFSITTSGFYPYLYIKIYNGWTQRTTDDFIAHIQKTNNIKLNIHATYIKKCKTLYGFDNHEKYPFLKIEFSNTRSFNTFRRIFIEYENEECSDLDIYDEDNKKRKKTKYITLRYPEGFSRKIRDPTIELYEAKIPPLLRYFHDRDILPAGWIEFDTCDVKQNTHYSHCDYNYSIDSNKIISLTNKHDNVPLKICSFDIEAMSNSGDFPQAIKTYEQTLKQLITKWDVIYAIICDDDKQIEIINFQTLLLQTLYTDENVYSLPIQSVETDMLKCPINDYANYCMKKIKSLFESIILFEGVKYTFYSFFHMYLKSENKTQKDKKRREYIFGKLLLYMNKCLVKLKGDYITFIGSTFTRSGENEPYLKHCIALNTCDSVENSVIVETKNERELLMEWRDLIINEDPDFIIGYK